MWWLQKASINKSLILWFTVATSQKDPQLTSPCTSWVFCCMPEACTYGSRSGINSITKVRSGRRPVCPCCTLTLWDFLFVTAWRRVQLREPDTVLTERWSSARSLHISPYLVLIGQSVLLAAQQQETHCVTIILRHMLFADFLFAPASACSTQRQTRSKTCSVLNPRDDVTSVRRLSHSDFRSKKGSWNHTHVCPPSWSEWILENWCWRRRASKGHDYIASCGDAEFVLQELNLMLRPHHANKRRRHEQKAKKHIEESAVKLKNWILG